jgi:Flp pilus assembly protein TadG
MVRRLARREEGAELIEMVLVTPILLMLLMGIVDFGFMFQRYVVLTNAAVEGARVATMPGYTAADAMARVTSYASGGGVSGTVTPVVTPVVVPGSNGGTWPGMRVTVTHVYTMQFLAPIARLFGGNGSANVTLTASSTMRNQVAGS